MPKRTRKQTQDINQFAADVVRRSTGIETAATPNQALVSQVMAAMGRKGGLKGAATLNARLSPAQRKKSAQNAARARWAKKDKVVSSA
jgi:hypothetical protein